jgi:hypothetical protein
MKERISILLLVVLPTLLFSQCPDVLPTGDFSMNFCNFPFAWEVTRGEHVVVGIFDYEINDSTAWSKRIKKLAPASTLQHHSMCDFLNKTLKNKEIQVVFISNEIKPSDYDRFIAALEFYGDIPIILPAYFGPMNGERDYSDWQNLLRKASENGAIISGSHGDFYQLGDLSFWKDIPVDIYAVMGREIDGFQAMMPDFKIEKNLENSSYLVVGAVALLKSKNPGHSNGEIKQLLNEKGRKVYWSHVEFPGGESGVPIILPHLDKSYLGKYEDEMIKKIERNVFEASTLDLMTLFDVQCPVEGGWCFNTLNIEEAQKKATGKGVTVAILDHTFNKNHEALKNRIVFPISFIEGEPALAERSDHGTEMAMHLVTVAPDVKIMPIVMSGEGHWGETELFIKGINYAVENGADIITCSQSAIKGDQNRLDEAIENASSKGVTFVYINYAGAKEEVVTPEAIEFEWLEEGNDIVYVIGTNFQRKETPITWGRSPTAPIVSGVIALLKEVQPDLQPLEIEKILLESTKKSYDGIPILDSNKALQTILK